MADHRVSCPAAPRRAVARAPGTVPRGAEGYSYAGRSRPAIKMMWSMVPLQPQAHLQPSTAYYRYGILAAAAQVNYRVGQSLIGNDPTRRARVLFVLWSGISAL
jgi:hypothetical protein